MFLEQAATEFDKNEKYLDYLLTDIEKSTMLETYEFKNVIKYYNPRLVKTYVHTKKLKN